VGASPLPLPVPCHRAPGKGGSLTGFAYGLDTEKAILAPEGVTGWRTQAPPAPDLLPGPGQGGPDPEGREAGLLLPKSVANVPTPSQCALCSIHDPERRLNMPGIRFGTTHGKALGLGSRKRMEEMERATK
jgi:hypothetical protein